MLPTPHAGNLLKSTEPGVSSLEIGQVLTQPIGYIESCFTGKNGTPRQPSICSLSRACLRISKKVFNNPEHSLIGLQQFSHIWILFIFHKNGHLKCKAKVQPPRLNGAKTGVFSTRSPHRPNAIGLTLAKLDKVEGDTVHLSGIDMIQGTPVIDIKPYIAEYDSPRPTVSLKEFVQEGEGGDASNAVVKTDLSEQHQERSAQDDSGPSLDTDKCEISDINCKILDNVKQKVALETSDEPSLMEDTCSLPEFLSNELVEDIITQKQSKALPCDGSANLSAVQDKPSITDSFVPKWVSDSPVPSLTVRFTPHSERELRQFKSPCESEPSFRFLQSFEEAQLAITNVLSADPRSIYRRNQCLDRLFYFSIDTIHITSWFGDGFAEVLKIQPVAGQPKGGHTN
ncbi:tRNA (adenine(37)-N6)-methyltransferase isoform X2 [Hyla sarda]|uniref:tRNA (adenine(37)-N6)-methyltransferase isoform X2 n=1 Tax=Hyla sarda TaxID=327740 RepID=UPI0024C23E75|nr:tRNA (adenine(37)-N6)-methyltransferase isoform X2 [Hyla sarda]